MNWTDSKLWKTIFARSNAAVNLTLQSCLPKVEEILRSGGTSPLDFTLHDDQHSFRVAERLFELAERQVPQLSDHELALLLLSAYLHDIGMSPSRKLVRSHYQYLLTGEDGLLNPLERQELQYWLDENWGGVTAPIIKTNSSSGLSLAEEICAYYCRARHNDWSEDWIEENLKDITPGLYPGWIDDLITLCKSHHQGFSELLDSKFDARLVGAPATAMNLRFLAALLRVADILEFDPERTPPIILQHRQIAPKSRIFWHRDQGIAFKINPNRPELILAARTPDALIHKAILSVAEYVNVELAGCHHLQQQGAFLHGMIPTSDRDKYQWQLPSQLSLDVKEKDDSFTYIEGTFRPDVTKLLGLLSGTQLYRNPLAAVRELVQNAADAIAEQIGYERLQQDDAEKPNHEAIFAGLHKVILTFERIGDRFWLRCNDDGIGLNKKSIETRLLVSGSNERPEFKALQREARAKGFEIFRTGQFGIGLLSYFMIADRVEFETRRSSAMRDSENTAWRFVTEGVSSFGELARSRREKHGTEVRLQLKDDTVGTNAEEWFNRLLEYLQNTVRHLPCKLELRNNLSNPAVRWATGPGWTADPIQFCQEAVSDFKESFYREITPEEQKSADELEARWTQVRELGLGKIRWFGPIERSSANLRARYWMPYFDLPGGASIALIDVADQRINQIGRYDGARTRAVTKISWKGFGIDKIDGRLNYSGALEIDICAGAEIAIDRASLSLQKPSELKKVALELEIDALAQFLGEKSNSSYDALNRAVMGRPTKLANSVPPNFHWKTSSKVGARWSKLTYPLAEIEDGEYLFGKTGCTYKGGPITTLVPITFNDTSQASASTAFGGGRLALVRLPFGWDIGRIWLEPPVKTGTLFCTTEFPKDWRKLLLVSTRVGELWNASHPLIKLMNEHVEQLQIQPFVVWNKNDLHERMSESLRSKTHGASFIISNLSDQRNMRAIKDRYPVEFTNLLRSLDIERHPLYWLKNRGAGAAIASVLNSSGFEEDFIHFEENLKFPDGTKLKLPSEEYILET